MEYPYRTGGGIIPAFRLTQYKPEPHEYLIATGDECARATDTRLGTSFAALHILGFIDVDTGEREEALTHMMWELSAEEMKDELYAGLFKERTAYRVKCLPPVKPWFSEPFKRTGNLYLTEILEADIHEPFIDGVIRNYIDSLHLHSELFGELDLVSEFPAYSGTFNWLGTEIKLIVLNEFPPAEKALGYMETFCRECGANDIMLRRFAAEQLTERAKELTESSLTREGFAAGMKIRYIEMDCDGIYTAEFLFNDQLITVDGDPGGPKNADIEKYYPEYDG